MLEARTPISHSTEFLIVYYEVAEEVKQQWKREWENCAKVAKTKEYFPTVQDRLNVKISMIPTTAAIVTRHGKTRAHLHHFKLLENATCVCMQGGQTN